MNSKHQANKEHELEQILKAGMEPLENEVEDAVPSQEWFEQFVLQRQKEMKAGLKRDLILFMIIASCLLIIFSISLVKLPALFLILQGVVFIGAAIFSSLTFFKQVKKI